MIKIETQLAVFLDNRPGMLARTCQALAKIPINILALSVQDTVDHAIVRMVVDKPKEAAKILSDMHKMVQEREVVVVDLAHEPGALAGIAEKLTESGINIEYAYCTAPSAERSAWLILRTNNLEETINALS